MKFKHSLIALSLLAFSSYAKVKQPLPLELWQDHKASRDVKNEKYEEALQKYLEMIEDHPERYGAHSNVGVILNMIQKPEDALKSLEHALKLAEEKKDTAGVFIVRYNLGTYYGAQKKIEQAPENYQAALDIVPTSIEAKTNIELLTQQQQGQGQGNGQGESNSQDKNDQQNKNGQGDQDKKDQKQDGQGDQDKKDEKEPKPDQQRESSSKYKPRPYKGDQLSEGDVKKILGELRNQEQKIRANFDKKEKGKSSRNEKDW